MQKNNKRVRIVVPAYNAGETIVECVDAICKATYCFENWELIVVDNGLNHNLDTFLKKYPIQILQKTKIRSAAYARNKGAENFLEGILVFIDSDVIIEKECLLLLTKPIINKSEIATIGNYSKEVTGLNFAQRYKQLYIHHVYSQNDSLIKNDFWTAISAIDASIFHQLNGFDCSFKGANGEDQEFGIRLTQKKYSVVGIPNANGKHINAYTVKKLVFNDFKKGITAMSNSLENKVPLKDNRHAKYRSINAVFFAALFALTFVLSILSVKMLVVSGLFFILWFVFRYNLVKICFLSQGAIFTIKALFLIVILDLVRCASVLVGVYQNLVYSSVHV